MRSSSLAAISVCALLVFPACGKIRERMEQKVAEKVAEQALEKQMDGGKVDIDTAHGTVTISGAGKEGSMQFGSGAKIPDGWPKSVPMYPNAQVVGSAGSPKGDMVMLRATANPDDVIAFYKKSLTGFEQQSTMDMGTMKMLALASKTEKIQVAFNVMHPQNDATTTIQITVTKTP